MLAVSVIEQHVICYQRPLICPVARQYTLFLLSIASNRSSVTQRRAVSVEWSLLLPLSGFKSTSGYWVEEQSFSLWTGLRFYCPLVFSRVFSLPFEILERNI